MRHDSAVMLAVGEPLLYLVVFGEEGDVEVVASRCRSPVEGMRVSISHKTEEERQL